jgi:hypothetical protein
MDDLEGRDRKAPLISTALIPVVRTFRSAVVAVTCATLLISACSASKETPADSVNPTLAPPEGRGLEPVPRPELSAMGEAVQQRIQQAYSALTHTVEDPRATPEQQSLRRSGRPPDGAQRA